ncbi:hypothetical protein ACE1TI_04935 [Alteribacillus sp. JSM 102045]|uniref:hypothetical protein n=1 Tax=Alteribacillus sp. JSM 102045 TaxID=1562101 RepID=UPI0035C1F9C2
MKVAVLGMNHGYKFASNAKTLPVVTLSAVAGNDKLSEKRAKELRLETIGLNYGENVYR